MAGWLIFIVAYIIFLAVGFTVAVFYRKHHIVKERRFFEELMKIRAQIYAQITAIADTYGDLIRITKKKEKSYFENTGFLDLGDAATLARDVRTNLSILKSELQHLRVFDDLARAKEGMTEIIEKLHEHIESLLLTENTSELETLLADKVFERANTELQKVNVLLETFMKDKGIESSGFSALEWLSAPRER